MTKIILNKRAILKTDDRWIKNVASKVFNLLEKDKNYECEINLICKRRMRILNKKFRSKNKATTILSFVANESKDFVIPISKRQYLGEIFLCPVEVGAEARKLKISTKEHMTRLIIHGILHLLGYDHEMEKNAVIMEKIEDDILTKCLGDI
jgi:probable rRNA maturation factor